MEVYLEKLGFVKLWRKVLKEAWYDQPSTVRLFTHLLLMCNHSEQYKIIYRRREYTLKPGEYWSTVSRIAQQTGLTIQQIRTGISTLEITNTLTRRTSYQGTVFTLPSYTKYHQATNDPTRGVTNAQQTPNKRLTIEQENKNIRMKEEEEEGASSSPIVSLEGDKFTVSERRIKSLEKSFPRVDIRGQLEIAGLKAAGIPRRGCYWGYVFNWMNNSEKEAKAKGVEPINRDVKRVAKKYKKPEPPLGFGGVEQ